jgi:hypothetical protein
LVVTGFGQEKGFSGTAHVIAVDLPEKKEVVGISGLAYVKEKDLLLFTVSSENTADATSDGAIGDSYLSYLPDISKNLSRDTLQAATLVNLSTIIEKRGVQKIESIAVEKVEGNALTIHLAADNDNGESTLFKMIWSLAQ